MANEKKMEILNRLVKDGSIDLAEALVLLETEKEYIRLPKKTIPIPFNPWNEPHLYPTNPYVQTGPQDWTEIFDKAHYTS